MPEELQPAIDRLDYAICTASKAIARARKDADEHTIADLTLAESSIEAASAALADHLTALEELLTATPAPAK